MRIRIPVRLLTGIRFAIESVKRNPVIKAEQIAFATQVDSWKGWPGLEALRKARQTGNVVAAFVPGRRKASDPATRPKPNGSRV